MAGYYFRPFIFKMITQSQFLIYKKSTGFQNLNLLNPIGKKVFAFLYYLWEKNNTYFHRITSIKVTSQDRPNDNGSPHSKGKAIDITITPTEFMPYIMGIMSSCLSFNFYLGTIIYVNKKEVKNLHIHIDEDYSSRKNTKFYEFPGNKLYPINNKNITYLLKLYNFDILDSLIDFGKFKKSTIELLTTTYPIGQKQPFESVVNLDIKEQLKQSLEKYHVNYWIYGILGLTALHLYYKFRPKRPEYITYIKR